jgi:hypothetical protein
MGDPLGFGSQSALLSLTNVMLDALGWIATN